MKIYESVQFNESLLDVSQNVVDSYESILGDIFKRERLEVPEELHPQAAEMFAFMSAHMSFNIDEGDRLYEDYTDAVNSLVLSECLTVCEKSTTTPSFVPPKAPDSWVKSTFAYQMMVELNREQTSRMVNGMWKVFYDKDNDTMHACLTKSQRASVLIALDPMAKESYFQSILPLDHDFNDTDEQYYAYSSSLTYFKYLTDSEPDSWDLFSRKLGISVDVLSAFSGFLVFLDFASKEVGHSFWYDDAFLEKLCEIYSEAWPRHGLLLNGKIKQLVSMFSLKPSESSKYLLPVPFFKLHGKYLRNPAFIKFQDISIALLTILIRNNEKLWSQTLGSTLAKAADQVLSTLPTFPNIRTAVRKTFKGGDVDLALYDTNTGHMLSIEIKTVYDKHKVDSLLHRFVNSKVNLPKAIKQLRETESVITSSSVNMMDIFGENLLKPIKIHNMLLNWFDAKDLTVGTLDEDIISLNFFTFRLMLQLSDGDLELMAKSIHELRNIWLVSRERDLDLGQEELNSYLEEQVYLIDSREDLATLTLSNISKKLVETFSSLSDIEDTESFKSYFKDTQIALG
jgi:hypothetical protein